MTIEQLNERIEAAKAKVAKKEATIARYEKTIAKKVGELADMGYTGEASWKACREANITDTEVRWTVSEIEQIRQDITRARHEIAATEATIAKYREAARKASEESAVEVPEVLSILAEQLVAEWDAWDIDRREWLNAKFEEVGLHEFYKRYATEAQLRDKTNEDIHTDNVRAAKFAVIDMIKRIRNEVGTVTDWEQLRAVQGNAGAVLNGFVEGTEGVVKVESITAGGWNIQRFHVRTLVHKLK